MLSKATIAGADLLRDEPGQNMIEYARSGTGAGAIVPSAGWRPR